MLEYTGWVLIRKTKGCISPAGQQVSLLLSSSVDTDALVLMCVSDRGGNRVGP